MMVNGVVRDDVVSNAYKIAGRGTQP